MASRRRWRVREGASAAPRTQSRERLHRTKPMRSSLARAATPRLRACLWEACRSACSTSPRARSLSCLRVRTDGGVLRGGVDVDHARRLEARDWLMRVAARIADHARAAQLEV